MGCWAWNTASCSAMAGVYPPTRQPRSRWRSISAWCAVNALRVALKLAEDAEQRAITIRTSRYRIRLILTISKPPANNDYPRFICIFSKLEELWKKWHLHCANSGNKIKLEPPKAQWPSTRFTCPSRREAEHAYFRCKRSKDGRAAKTRECHRKESPRTRCKSHGRWRTPTWLFVVREQRASAICMRSGRPFVRSVVIHRAAEPLSAATTAHLAT